MGARRAIHRSCRQHVQALGMALDLLGPVLDRAEGVRQHCARARVAPLDGLPRRRLCQSTVTTLDVNRTGGGTSWRFQAAARLRQPASRLPPVRNHLTPLHQRGVGPFRSFHSAEAMLLISDRWPKAVRTPVAAGRRQHSIAPQTPLPSSPMLAR